MLDSWVHHWSLSYSSHHSHLWYLRHESSRRLIHFTTFLWEILLFNFWSFYTGGKMFWPKFLISFPTFSLFFLVFCANNTFKFRVYKFSRKQNFARINFHIREIRDNKFSRKFLSRKFVDAKFSTFKVVNTLFHPHFSDIYSFLPPTGVFIFQNSYPCFTPTKVKESFRFLTLTNPWKELSTVVPETLSLHHIYYNCIISLKQVQLSQTLCTRNSWLPCAFW